MLRLLAGLGLAAMLFTTNVEAQGTNATRASLEILRKMQPHVTWDASTAVNADLTCTGGMDTAVVGYTKDRVWLGVVPAANARSSRKPVVDSFSVGKHSQNSFCGVPVKIETHTMDCDTETGVLLGCVPIEGCMGFSLIDGMCDSFHFYWDSDRRALTWWRR